MYNPKQTANHVLFCLASKYLSSIEARDTRDNRIDVQEKEIRDETEAEHIVVVGSGHKAGHTKSEILR